jgi:DNA-binding beta-propeller fold protein YncE
MMKTLAAALLTLFAATAAPHYRVARHIKVGGTGGWDYLTVDSASQRLYVSHAERVDVVDLKSGEVVAMIPRTEGVHGIALAPKAGRGFISNGKANTVTIFDLKSSARIEDVKTGERPDAILFEPVTSRVFTFNAAGHDTTALTTDGHMAGSIPLGGKPEFAVADGQGHVFVNIEDTSELAELDAKALKVVRRWKLTGCEEPSGLALDAAQHRLFSGCENKVMAVSDARAGKAIGTIPAGTGIDGNAFDPQYGLAFSANGRDGTITVADAKSLKVVETVPTQDGARTIALDPATHHLYLPTAQFGPGSPRRSIVPETFEVLDVAP